MKQKFRIFPDHCSSGIWGMPPDHCNYDESSISDAVPAHLMVALKYWHRVWNTRHDYMENGGSISETIKQTFDEDGQIIVDAMNASQDKYEFVYVKSY